jgi:hypothetical protein
MNFTKSIRLRVRIKLRVVGDLTDDGRLLLGVATGPILNISDYIVQHIIHQDMVLYCEHQGGAPK